MELSLTVLQPETAESLASGISVFLLPKISFSKPDLSNIHNKSKVNRKMINFNGNFGRLSWNRVMMQLL